MSKHLKPYLRIEHGQRGVPCVDRRPLRSLEEVKQARAEAQAAAMAHREVHMAFLARTGNLG